MVPSDWWMLGCVMVVCLIISCVSYGPPPFDEEKEFSLFCAWASQRGMDTTLHLQFAFDYVFKNDETARQWHTWVARARLACSK